MAFRHEVLHVRRQKQRLIDIPGPKILAHSQRLNQTRLELNSDYSDRLLGLSFRDGPKDQTLDVQLHIGESRDSGFASSTRPGMTSDRSAILLIQKGPGKTGAFD